jgi:hypothetical protein
MTVSGLRHRLESLEGVASIELELGDEGLAGIRVTLTEGADEAELLESIRSLLVAYGVRSEPQPADGASIKAADMGETITTIEPEGDLLRIQVGRGGRRASRTVPPEPLAAAQAVADARAELEGRLPARVLWMGLDRIGAWRVLTVLSGREGAEPEVGAAVVSKGWEEAVGKAVGRSLPD